MPITYWVKKVKNLLFLFVVNVMCVCLCVCVCVCVCVCGGRREYVYDGVGEKVGVSVKTGL